MHDQLLLVDDDQSLRPRLATVLAEIGFRVWQAASAEEALRILHPEHRYLAAEFSLPGMSGLDLLLIVRRWCPDIRVVLLAREPAVEDAVAAFRAGATDYLPKPFTLGELVRALWGRGKSTGPVQSAAELQALYAYRQSLLLAGRRLG